MKQLEELVEIGHDKESGQLILDIPAKIAKRMRWKEGDLLRLQLRKNGEINVSSSGKKTKEI